MTITVLTAAGTWAPWEIGYPADVARAVVSEWDWIQAEIMGEVGPKFHWQPIGYPAIGFLTPDPNTSYNESVAAGVAEGVRLGQLATDPDGVVVIGYSQGAEVAVRVATALKALGVRIRAVITFGPPCRRPGPTLLGNNPPGSGISRYYGDPELWPVTYDFTLPGDMYGNATDDTYLPEFYSLFVQAEASMTFFAAALQFAMPYVAGGLGAVLTGNPFALIGVVDIPKAIKTATVLVEFASTNAHMSYHVPRAEYGGRSAVDTAIGLLHQIAA